MEVSMTRKIGSALLLAGIVALALAGLSPAQDGEAPDPIDVARKLVGKNWDVERELIPGLDRCLPGVHSFWCRMRAMGGAPYERIVISEKGDVLHRIKAKSLHAWPKAKALEVRIEGKKAIVKDTGGMAAVADMAPVIETGLRLHAPSGKDPGASLSFSIALVSLLTVKWTFHGASVTTAPGGGFVVQLDWTQGSVLWSFEERAHWSLTFDKEGALISITKAQVKCEFHGRK